MIVSFRLWVVSNDQGEVYIRGKKRAGLISDEEISGLRIGLVSALPHDDSFIFYGLEFCVSNGFCFTGFSECSSL